MKISLRNKYESPCPQFIYGTKLAYNLQGTLKTQTH